MLQTMGFGLFAHGRCQVSMGQALGLCKFSSSVGYYHSFNGLPRYYVLVAACVFARKIEWVKEACLAAALLFPAVAAIHGIVLAAVRVDGKTNDPVLVVASLLSIL